MWVTDWALLKNLHRWEKKRQRKVCDYCAVPIRQCIDPVRKIDFFCALTTVAGVGRGLLSTRDPANWADLSYPG